MALISLPPPRLLFSSPLMSIAQKNLIPNLVPMATQNPNSNRSILHTIHFKGVAYESGSIDFQYKTKLKSPTQRRRYKACCFLGVAVPSIQLPVSAATVSADPVTEASNAVSESVQRLVLMDLDQATAKLAIAILGPFLSAFSFLFIVRIVMSWYPKLPVGKFPYIVAYAPTEPVLILTRKVIPPLAGVDVTPVVWFGLISFLNEILVGPQGLLVLLSQQV